MMDEKTATEKWLISLANAYFGKLGYGLGGCLLPFVTIVLFVVALIIMLIGRLLSIELGLDEIAF